MYVFVGFFNVDVAMIQVILVIISQKSEKIRGHAKRISYVVQEFTLWLVEVLDVIFMFMSIFRILMPKCVKRKKTVQSLTKLT